MKPNTILDIDDLAGEWAISDIEYRNAKQKRDKLEDKIFRIMKQYGWKNMKCRGNISISVIKVDKTDFNMNGLKLLLPVKDIESLTRHHTEDKLIIVHTAARAKFKKELNRA